jgi:hypothetical protein
MHLIEFHDQAWFPAPLRDAVTDMLEFILGSARLYAPIVPRLQEALGQTAAQCIVDLCSGAGGPWLWMLRILEKHSNVRLSVCLTDKYPNTGAFGHAKNASENRITFHAAPVDATQIPAELKGFRTLFTSFHHFNPREARAILQDAVRNQEGIGIFEVAGRHPLTLLCVFLVPILALVLALVVRPFRWSRLIWSYLIPVVPFVLFFDGIVSCLRTYSAQELSELTGGLSSSGYTWETGREKKMLMSLPVTYLIGYPSLPAATSGPSRSSNRRLADSAFVSGDNPV